MHRALSCLTVIAALAAGPSFAQQANTPREFQATEKEALPQVEAAVVEAAEKEELRTVIESAVSAQQFGNLATTKTTSGLVGDLGGVMALLNSQAISRLETIDSALVEPARETMPEAQQEQLDAVKKLNGQEFALAFGEWVTQSYPQMISEWRAVEDTEGLQPLAQDVIEQLEAQQQVAEKIVAANGDLDEVDDQIRQTLAWGGAMEQGEVVQQPGDQSTGVTTVLPEENEPGSDGEEATGSVRPNQ